MALASEKNFSIAKTLPPHHAAMLGKLSKLKGGDFDAAYGKVQVDSHVEAVSLFEGASKSAKDADLKA